MNKIKTEDILKILNDSLKSEKNKRIISRYQTPSGVIIVSGDTTYKDNKIPEYDSCIIELNDLEYIKKVKDVGYTIQYHITEYGERYVENMEKNEN